MQACGPGTSEHNVGRVFVLNTPSPYQGCSHTGPRVLRLPPPRNDMTSGITTT